jgi:hypothetical protein
MFSFPRKKNDALDDLVLRNAVAVDRLDINERL